MPFAVVKDERSSGESRECQIIDRVARIGRFGYRIKEGSITAYFNSEIIKITENEIEVKTPEGVITLENDFVLAMTGYKIDYSFLESMGVKIQDDNMRTPVYDSESNETNQRNIYLAGVICGGLKTNKWFIENSREHATVIIDHLVKKLKKEIV